MSIAKETCSDVIVSTKIREKFFKALIDTGSCVNLIRKNVHNQIGQPSYNPTVRMFHGLGQKQVSPIGVSDINIEVNGEEYSSPFYIMADRNIAYDVILGREFLQNCELIMSGGLLSIKKLNRILTLETERDLNATENINGGYIFMCNSDIVPDSCELDVDKRYEAQITEMCRLYTPRKIYDCPIKTNLVLTDDVPIYQRARRLAPLEAKIVSEQVDEWLREGIIVPCESEYSSPVVVVRKKDGRYRLCIDYRRLNKVIRKDRFPMQRIDDQLDKLANFKIFSTLDLRNGFFHVPMNNESMKYTAFSTADGQFMFRKTPFGLCNSPASFNRFVSMVFSNLIKQNIVIQYVDDIIIPSDSYEEGIQRLRIVLQVAENYGLEFNWMKCQFLKTSVEYLGYVISDSKIFPSKKKIEAVKQFPVPINEKQLQSFLGLTNYFRKFVNGYGMIVAPLTRLLKKDTKHICFDNEQMLSFEAVKERLTCNPVLQIYDPSAETELHTDGSKVGLGGILLQRKYGGEFHPVHFWSKATTDAEKNYHSYELEVLAIVEAVKSLRPYLLGVKFKIITDCAAFQKTVNKSDIPPRVKRWTLYLEEYDYTMEHRKGERMKHVDALSRNPVGVVENTLRNLVKSMQRDDQKIDALKRVLQKESYEDYFICDGILMKKDDGRDVLVVPQEMERDLIKKAHGKGHFAVHKTMEILRADFYIDKMRSKVEQVIQSCIECIIMNRKHGKREGYLCPIPKDDLPLVTLHIDHLGPMTLTSKCYKYIFVAIDGFSKFTWIYPTKTTSSKEVLERLEKFAKTFGYPERIISDKGSAFTSNDFQQFCVDKNIQHIQITTGVPRGNGQVERVNDVITSILSKLSINEPEKWFKYVDQVQRCINSTFHRVINSTPHEVLTGVKMRTEHDINVMNILHEEIVQSFMDDREDRRQRVRESIQKAQESQRLQYNKNKKQATRYTVGSIVAIKRTQFGPNLKLKSKYFGPYEVIKVKPNNRYEVKRVGAGEGPIITSTSSDLMKEWKI